MLRHLIFILLCTPSLAQAQENKFALVIHGGAGTLLKSNITPEQEKQYRDALQTVLDTGYAILNRGADAMDAVERCIQMMEDDPLFNAGRGAVLTSEGKAELDASVMDGRTHLAGAVAGVTNVRHPISAARKVMEQSQHVMLTGKGAETFAEEQGLEIVKNEWFHTPRRLEQLQKEKEKEKAAKENGNGDAAPVQGPDNKHGTVGVVALDKAGNLAAGTSTGGMMNKRWGRVGDSPIIGAGTYADNATCAVSCTGHGEYFIRGVVAYDVSAVMEYTGLPLVIAAKHVIEDKLTAAGGTGGLIALDKECNIAMEFNTPGMYRGYVTQQGEKFVAIFRDE